MTLSPRTVRAGRTATLRLTVAAANVAHVLSAGRVQCTATAGRTRLKPSTAGFRPPSAAGRVVGSCAWRVPRKARGKTLRATLRVLVDGAALSRAVSRKIR
jgi:hypothetical protein